MIQTDMDFAITLIKVSAQADHGCNVCTVHSIEYAMTLQPDLPWRLAAEGLVQDDPYTYGFALDPFVTTGDPE